MEFTVKNPPIKNNQQRSYKRSLNLHLALLIISVAAIITRAFISVPDGETWVPNQMFQSFFMLFIAAFTSVIIELLYSIQEGKSHEFNAYSRWVDPINTGLLIALLLPTSTPIYVLVLAVFVGVYIGKLVFGGYGYYIFNPALVGVLFANISFSRYLTFSDTPIVLLKDVLEGTTYNFNMAELFFGNYEAVAIGTTCVMVLLGLFIYLLVTRVIDFKISGTFLGSILVISLIVGYINFSAGALNYTLVNAMTGMILFGTIFLVPDSVTSPTSREAKLIYAVVVAVMTMIVRTVGSGLEGVVFAVLLGNMITPYINRTVTRSNKHTLIKTSIILVLVVLFTGVILGFMVQGRLIDIFNSLVVMGGGIR